MPLPVIQAVFAHHHDVIDTIAEGLREKGISVVTLTGKEDAAQRQSAVDRFQAGKESVLIGSIEAAGVGLTLTRASRVLFAESSWTPTKLQQAEDRAHRIGQVDTVFVSHLVFDNSLDGKMLGMIIDKMNIADLALDGSRKTQDPSPVAPDFSGEQKAAVEVVSMPREETRYERRLREAAANPDGMYLLETPVPSLESHGTAFKLERTIRDGRSYLFVAAMDPESGDTIRIKDQDEQDKILATVVADKQSATRYFQMKAELAAATESIPDGYYAVDGTGQNSVDYYSISRGSKGVKVDRYVGGTGAVAMPSLASQVSAAKSIAVDPKASATRFACELGYCFCCCRPLTNDESRKEGIGPDCRENHQWFKRASTSSLELP